MDTKQCKVCFTIKPDNIKNFSKMHMKEGTQDICIQCKKSIMTIGVSWCPNCGEVKPTSDFHNRLRNGRLLKCKICRIKYDQENSDKLLGYRIKATKEKLLGCNYLKFIQEWDFRTHRTDTIKVPIVKGNYYNFKVIAFTYVDADWIDLVKNYMWGLCCGYAVSNYSQMTRFLLGVDKNKTQINKFYVTRLHRFVKGLTNDSNLVVDHINRNRLDNRSSNLRICDKRQNSFNRRCNSATGVKGVYFITKESVPWAKYKAGITLNGKSVHLGYFVTIEEAARAYDSAAKEHFGEFAYLNNI